MEPPLKSALKNERGMALPVPELFTIKVSGWLAVCCGEEESATCTLKLNCPVWVVVPDIDPEVCNVIPVGRVPVASVHEYGAVPPEAVRGFE